MNTHIDMEPPMTTTANEDSLSISRQRIMDYGRLLTLLGNYKSPTTWPVPVMLRNLPEIARIKELRAQGELPTPPADRTLSAEISTWQRIFTGVASECGSNARFLNALDLQTAYLRYENMGGTLIQTTQALEQILLGTDLSDDLPAHLFMPPFTALYLHFTPYAAKALRVPAEFGVDGDTSGVFFLSDFAPSGLRRFYLIATLNRKNLPLCFMGTSFTLFDGESHTLNDAIEAVVTDGTSASADWNKRMLGMVAKVFLYMGMKESRQVMETPQKDMQARLALLGNKKRSKLERQCERLYDRISVGPEFLPQELQGDGYGQHTVAPHWRRGHFKMQPYGPKSALRKMLFVMPTLIGKDRLGNQEMPAPKTYKVG